METEAVFLALGRQGKGERRWEIQGYVDWEVYISKFKARKCYVGSIKKGNYNINWKKQFNI